MMWTLRKEVEFDAAHRLPGHKGKCENLHGHRWTVYFEIESEELNDMDMVVDFGSLSAMVRELDHLYINDLEVFKTMLPTAENMACYFANRVLIVNPHVSRVRVSVEESPGAEVCYEQWQARSE
jgi:6-pyruvoyltetrahydropterin/6-carboxytetrahydropterin synthase